MAARRFTETADAIVKRISPVHDLTPITTADIYPLRIKEIQASAFDRRSVLRPVARAHAMEGDSINLVCQICAQLTGGIWRLLAQMGRECVVSN